MMARNAAIPMPGPGCPPFVLLDDARADGAVATRLFTDPVDTLSASKAADIPALLDALQAARRRGLFAAGYLAYDAGKGLATTWRGAVDDGTADDGAPLGWFGLFERARRIDADAVATLLPDPASAWIGHVAPRIAQADYQAAVEAVLELIRAGDIYQANLTFRADVPVQGNPLAV